MFEITDHEQQLAENPTKIDATNLTVLVGDNNSGKSTLMRNIAKNSEGAYFVNVNRTVLTGEGALNKNYVDNALSYAFQIRDAGDDNVQNKSVQILQDLFNLNDDERKKIIDYYNAHFPAQASVEKENPQNDASPRLLKMSGYPITKQGSGARAILEILVKLFDPSIGILCIDEPEIALEPKLQKQLFKAIKGKSSEKQIFIATHSHHFLDTEDFTNNYICARDERGKVFLTQITSSLQIRNVIFELLGNDLKDIGLPDNLIILEGISDAKFVNKSLELLGKNGYSVFDAGSDSKIKTAAEGISAYLKFVSDLASIYNDKIWIMSDVQTHDGKVREWRTALNDQADQGGRVKALSKNGIEYYYPERILQSIFQTTDNRDAIVDGYLGNNPNGYNSIEHSKNELAVLICNQLQAADLVTGNEVVDFISNLP